MIRTTHPYHLIQIQTTSNYYKYSFFPLAIVQTRRCRNSHSKAFQLPSASIEAYKGSFFPQTIRNWNELPDSLFSTAEGGMHGDPAVNRDY